MTDHQDSDHKPRLEVDNDGLAKIYKNGALLYDLRMPTKDQIRQQHPSYAAADFILYHLDVSHDGPQSREKLSLEEYNVAVFYSGYVNRTLQEMSNEFRSHQKTWENSQACTLLKAQMSILMEECPVENIIAFGIGSLQDVHDNSRRTSHLQTAALLTVVECVQQAHQQQQQQTGSKEQQRIKCLAQEPQYTSLDKEFLLTLGIIAVDDPVGFLSISEKSLYLSINTYAYMERVISEGPWPAAMIVNDLDTILMVDGWSTISLNEKETQLIKDMFQDCKALPFPAMEKPDGEGSWTPNGAVTMYWREMSDNEGKKNHGTIEAALQ